MKIIKSIDEVMDSMSLELQMIALENQFPYIFSKAKLFIDKGVLQFRELDFFGQPATEDPEMITLIELGCNQILNGNGFSFETPLMDIGVNGFYDLMEMFHFECESRKSKYGITFQEKKGVVDCITFIHVVDARKATLYNFCELSYSTE